MKSTISRDISAKMTDSRVVIAPYNKGHPQVLNPLVSGGVCPQNSTFCLVSHNGGHDQTT